MGPVHEPSRQIGLGPVERFTLGKDLRALRRCLSRKGETKIYEPAGMDKGCNRSTDCWHPRCTRQVVRHGVLIGSTSLNSSWNVWTVRRSHSGRSEPPQVGYDNFD